MIHLENPADSSMSTFDIVGTTDWRIVRGEALTRYPLSNLCLIEVVFERSGPRFRGTGWLASPNTVVTAGHVIDPPRSRNSGRFRLKMEFPGSSSQRFTAIAAKTHPDWRGAPAELFDVGVIRLPIPLSQQSLIQAIPNRVFDGISVTIPGFPLHHSVGRRLVTHTERVLSSNKERFFHQVDVEDGHSGAPVIIRKSNGFRVIGIHVGGFLDSGVFNANLALTWSRSIADFVKFWITEWR